MALAVFFMVYAVALPIGWEEGRGPGGGAFPFWLSVGMLISGAAILWKQTRHAMAASQRSRVYIDQRAVPQIVVVALSLAVTVALVGWLGAYVAIPAFLLFHLKFTGRQSWLVTAPIVLGTPVLLFFFFEVTLKILLPKGVTEPLFLPLYAAFF
jgi:hypothetical protein